MSHDTLRKTIERELQKLNDEIDVKIVKGLSYVKESRRHKFMLKRLNELGRASGLFQKSFKLISTFVL